MEMDDLKGAWAQYDKKLSESLKFNEELLRKMNLNSSKCEMQKLLILQVGSIIIAFAFIASVTVASVGLIDEPEFCFPGFFSALIGMLYLTFKILKLTRFLSIDYFSSPIVKLQKDIARLNKFVLTIRKFEFILIPFLVIPLFPLLFKSMFDMDIYTSIRLFTFEVIFCLGVGMPVAFWINKYTDRKISHAIKLLEELDRFEKEE